MLKLQLPTHFVVTQRLPVAVAGEDTGFLMSKTLSGLQSQSNNETTKLLSALTRVASVTVAC